MVCIMSIIMAGLPLPIRLLRINRPKSEDSSAKNEKPIPYSLVSTSFAGTGKLSEDSLKIAKTINPKYAFCNCGIVSYKIANLLEHDRIATDDDLGLFFSSLPRPIEMRVFIQKNPLIIQGHRGWFEVSVPSKARLDLVMKNFGEKTHAVVDGGYRGILGKANIGHYWNYVVLNDGSNSCVVIDGYRASYYKKGLKDPEGYFNMFEGELNAIIFYEKTPKNNSIVAHYR